MKTVFIDEALKEQLPDLVLGVLEADVVVDNSSADLLNEMNRVMNMIEEKLSVGDLKDLPGLKSGRASYRTLGKDPTKYRISSEKLLRRAIKGQGLGSINNVVDVSNIVSMESAHSVGTYDSAKIGDELVFSFGKEGETYQSLGSQVINLNSLPIFKDDQGAFGSSTTDSSRSIVTLNSKRIIMNIIAFSGEENLDTYIDLAEKLLIEYCDAKNIIKQIIK